MGRLSTHVLDVVRGQPARGVVIELHRSTPDGGWDLVTQAQTNADGRTDEPLMSGLGFAPGTYMLTFHMGAYFKDLGTAASESPFLDLVPIRFTIAEPDGHYHIPLLAGPWSYTTYRGS
jgi:5-hydroxyisourate hydrolase